MDNMASPAPLMPCGLQSVDNLILYQKPETPHEGESPAIPAFLRLPGIFGSFPQGLQKTRPKSIYPHPIQILAISFPETKNRYSSTMCRFQGKSLALLLRKKSKLKNPRKSANSAIMRDSREPANLASTKDRRKFVNSRKCERHLPSMAL
jgi:hypothetical protein